MENEKTLKERLGYNHNYLELARVAESYLKQGGTSLAQKSLELLLKDMVF